MALPGISMILETPKFINTMTTVRTNANASNKYDILGIEVLFPYQAYPSQIEYMKSVIDSISNKKNALLESPTGTGKTLCLLCAALAWLKNYKEKNLSRSTKIIYSTRTHSQISQVIKELKKTPYEPSVIVLGSREMMCVNQEINSNERTKLDMLCKKSIKKNLCKYYMQKQKAKDFIGGKICDIEELTDCGVEKCFCPFFYSRDNMNNCDLLLMPYNYAIDPKIRTTLQIDFLNSILIFDEAHNVGRTCEDASSVEFYDEDLNECLKELDEIEKLRDNANRYEEIKEDLMSMTTPRLNSLKPPIRNFIAFLQSRSITSVKGFRLMGKDAFKYFLNGTKSQNEVLSDFANNGINEMNGKAYMELIFTAGKILLFIKGFANLNNWARVVETVLLNLGEESKVKKPLPEESFGIIIIDEEENTRYDAKGGKSKKKRKFGMWCFNPGFQFQQLVNSTLPPRSVILTSGTLSPLDTLENDLSVSFPIKLESAHVIKKEQVFAGILCRDDEGCPMNIKYENRDNKNVQNSITTTVRAISGSTKGGILIFFPSYALLNLYERIWKKELINFLKSKNVDMLKEGKTNEENEVVLKMYMSKINSNKTAILLAVCRGKVSEGLDFADNAARVVIVIGIPYPSYVDPRVEMKKEYLDKKGVSITGRAWYNLEGIKAINQSIGRVIRHINDYGAIIIIDERMASNNCKSFVSKWVRDYMKPYDAISPLIKEMTSFFKYCNGESRLNQSNGYSLESKRPSDIRNMIMSTVKHIQSDVLQSTLKIQKDSSIEQEEVKEKKGSKPTKIEVKEKKASKPATIYTLTDIKCDPNKKPSINGNAKQAFITSYFAGDGPIKRKHSQLENAGPNPASTHMFGIPPDAKLNLKTDAPVRDTLSKQEFAERFLLNLKELVTNKEYLSSQKELANLNEIPLAVDQFNVMKKILFEGEFRKNMDRRMELLGTSKNFINKNNREEYTQLICNYIEQNKAAIV